MERTGSNHLGSRHGEGRKERGIGVECTKLSMEGAIVEPALSALNKQGTSKVNPSALGGRVSETRILNLSGDSRRLSNGPKKNDCAWTKGGARAALSIATRGNEGTEAQGERNYCQSDIERKNEMLKS
jgi:hypothetical protein